MQHTQHKQGMKNLWCKVSLENQTIDLNDNQIIGVKDPSATKHALYLQCWDGRFMRKVVHGYMTMIWRWNKHMIIVMLWNT